MDNYIVIIGYKWDYARYKWGYKYLKLVKGHNSKIGNLNHKIARKNAMPFA